MKYLGDFISGSTIRGSFNTRTAAGVPITLAGTPVLSVYKDGGTTETATGVTLTVDFDSRTGHHVYTVATSDAFYSTGSDYRIVITTGTVDGTSVVGTEVGSFSIQNRTALIASGVRSALGLASANLDTQLAALPASTTDAVCLGLASGSAIYIAKNGNDANSGLAPNKAKLTIAAGVSTASGAGIKNIIIGDGDWTETGIVMFNGMNVVASEGARFASSAATFTDNAVTGVFSITVNGIVACGDSGFVNITGTQSSLNLVAERVIGAAVVAGNASNSVFVRASIGTIESTNFTSTFTIDGASLTLYCRVANAGSSTGVIYLANGNAAVTIETLVNISTGGRTVLLHWSGTSNLSLSVGSHSPQATGGILVAVSSGGTNTASTVRIHDTNASPGLFSGNCANVIISNSIGSASISGGNLTYVNSTGPVTVSGTATARISNSNVSIAQSGSSVVTVDATTVITSLTGSVTRLPIANVTLVDTTTTNTDMLTEAGVRSALGLASANLDTQLATIDSLIDAIKAKTDSLPSDPATETTLAVLDGLLDAVKAKTDQLAFSISGQVDANALTGGGGGGLDAAGVRAAIGLASANLDTQLSNIPANVRTNFATELARIDVGISTRLATAGYTAPANSDIAAIKLKTDNLPSDPADQSAVEAAVTAATSGLATAASLATVAGYLDTEITAILEDTGTTIPAQIAALNNLSSAQVITALGAGSWATAIPWNSAWDAEVQSECADALAAYDPPTKAELDAAVSPLATASDLTAVKTTTDRLGGMLVQDGLVYQFTSNALELAPTGSGGGSGGGSDYGEVQSQTSTRRGTTEYTPIQFTFPTGSLANSAFTKTKRIDGGTSQSVVGTITYLYQLAGLHWYSLSYSAADRPANDAQGIVQYVITDGTDTIGVSLLVSDITTANPVQSPEQNPAPAGSFFIWSGVDFSEDFEVSIPSGWDKVLFTVKDGRDIDDGSDAKSILQLQVSSPSDESDGVLFLNRSNATDKTLGSITVANDRESVTVTLSAELTAQLKSGKTYNWDIAVIEGDAKPYLSSPGTVTIKDVVTKTLPT